jgi:diacylglycerol kinase (ATP)
VETGNLNRQKPQGLTRLFRAFGYSYAGFVQTFREEAAFRQELLCAAVVIPLGIHLGRSGLERALLIAPMLLVLIVESLNSAIEAVVDRHGLEHNDLAGMAKDMGSAAVLLCFALLGTTWFLILWDH